MPAADDVLADVVAHGGELATLRVLAKADLLQALKALGYSKLGDRMRVASAIADCSAAAAAAPSASAASDSSSTTVEDGRDDGKRTMVMHGAVQDICDDGGLLKTTLRAGDNSASVPPPLSKVKVRYIASLLPECLRFEALVKEFHVGEHEVPKGLERCVGTMRKGETCELICRAEYAYGDAGRPPDVPPGASIRYEVELISVVLPKKERSEYTAADLVQAALELKSKGTSAFSSGLWLEAQVAYHEASRLLLTPYDVLVAVPGKEAESRSLLVACLLNAAQCALKREEWYAAEKLCSEVLERLSDPLGAEREQNAKALFRRAKARIGRSEFKLARADVKVAHGLTPSSREVRDLWDSIKEREETSTASEDQVYARMTSKLMYREYNVGKKKLSSYPRVYLEVAIDGVRLPRIVFELFVDRAPKTCENFRCLCTGEKGTSERGTRLHYKGTKFWRGLTIDDLPPEFINESADGTGRQFEIWKGFLVQGGDITGGDGTGGESIYGEPFEDELGNYDYVKHTHPGLLSMAGSLPMRDKAAEEYMHVPHNNTSQFFITTKAKNQAQGGQGILHFDGRHCCFGKVVEGMKTVNKMNKVPVNAALFHAFLDEHKVEIVDCGQLLSEEEMEAKREEDEFQKLNPVFMIPDKKDEEEAVEVISRATWAGLGAGEADEPFKPTHPPHRPPPAKPTPEDDAIRSAEIEDDE